jgi:hypothetical protein
MDLHRIFPATNLRITSPWSINEITFMVPPQLRHFRRSTSIRAAQVIRLFAIARHWRILSLQAVVPYFLVVLRSTTYPSTSDVKGFALKSFSFRTSMSASRTMPTMPKS